MMEMVLTDCDDSECSTDPSCAPAGPCEGDFDCDGTPDADDIDADGDMFLGSAFGGNDCDDTNPDAYPGACRK